MDNFEILVLLFTFYWLGRNLLLLSGRKGSAAFGPDLAADAESRRAGAGPLPFVSVIIPARDEEDNIGPCLDSVLAQDYGSFEVLVVDDQSTDGTAGVVRERAAADSRVRLIEGKPLPGGWLGKPFALHQGCTAAAGDFFWMIDADTRHNPRGLRSVVDFAVSRKAGLVTLVPRLEGKSFWEKAVQPLFYTWFDYRLLARVNNPDVSDVVACGPYFLVTRACCEKVGGFEAHKSKLLEDLEFARSVKSSGERFILARGLDLYTLRMYQGGGGLWKGWTKTFGGGLAGRRWLGFFLASSLVLLSVTPFLLPAAGVFFLVSGSIGPAGLAGCFAPMLLVLVFRLQSDRINMQDARYGLTHPLGALFMAFVMLKAGFSGGGVEWKGRSYVETRNTDGGYTGKE